MAYSMKHLNSEMNIDKEKSTSGSDSIKTIVQNIDKRVEEITILLKEHAEKTKTEIANYEKRETEKLGKDETIKFKYYLKKPDLRKELVTLHELVGDIEMNHEVVSILKPSFNFKDKTQKVHEVENGNGIKISCHMGDITEMKSDICLVLLSNLSGPPNIPITKYILEKAGTKIYQEVSGWGKYKYSNFETSGGDLECQKIFYVKTDLNLRSYNEKEIYNYFEKKIKEIFNGLRFRQFKSLSISLDYGEHLNYNNKSFAVLMFRLLMNSLIDLNIHGFDMHFFTDKNDVYDEIVSDMRTLTVIKNDKQEIHFPSGTHMELCRKSLFDLQVDAIMIIVFQDFGLGTTLGRIIFDLIGSEIKKELDRKKSKHEKRTVLVTKGYTLNCKNILFCRSPSNTSPKDKLKALKDFMFEAIQIVKKKNIKTLAMPLLGAGNYLLPVNQCLEVLEESMSKNNFGKVIISIPEESQNKTIMEFEDYFMKIDPCFKLKKTSWFESKNNLNKQPESNSYKLVSSSYEMHTNKLTSLNIENNYETKNEGRTSTNLPIDQTYSGSKHLNKIEDENHNALDFESVFENSKDESKVDENNKSNVNNILTTNFNIDPSTSSTGTNKKTQWYYTENGKKFKYPPKINQMLEKNYLDKKTQSRWSESNKIYVVDYITMLEHIEINGKDDDSEDEQVRVMRLTDDESE